MQNDSVCYVKAAFPLMGKILERTEFKENSSNARKMQMVRRMYDHINENVDPCIREEDDEERMVQYPQPRGGLGLGPHPGVEWDVQSIRGEMGCPEHPGVGAWAGPCSRAEVGCAWTQGAMRSHQILSWEHRGICGSDTGSVMELMLSLALPPALTDVLQGVHHLPL